MPSHITKRIAPMLVPLFLVLTVTAWAQNGESRIDSGHSTASLSVVSSRGRSWNIGIAKVSGTVTFNDDAGKDAVNLYIYPAREGSRLLNSEGGFRAHSFANLSRYSVMTFHSSSFTRNQEGKLMATGELSVTHVQRDPSIDWTNAYSGPDYSQPVGQTTTHAATFIFEAESFGAQNRTVAATRSAEDVSALGTVNLHKFPALKIAWLDSVWPLVVEDEHCQTPVTKADFRDYSGPKCTGTPVLPTSIAQPPERFGLDYPGPDIATAPAADEATILLHLRLKGHN